jgi:hypothetical protein
MENEKTKHVCRKFGLLNSSIQTIWKTNQNYECEWTEIIKKKAITRAWTKWRRVRKFTIIEE